jgi:lactate dehydrogenase-like 2-hydroxyacid dehydrogenase
MSAPEQVRLLQVGSFPPEVQARLDAEFRCVAVAELDADPALAQSIRGVVTRSNQDVPAALVERLPQLEIIATNGVGYDLIPLALAARRGIVVTNTPDVLNAAVAELCIGSLLGLLRKLPQADRFVGGDSLAALAPPARARRSCTRCPARRAP